MEDYLFEKKKLKIYLGETLYNIFKSFNVIVAGGTITSLFTNHDINDIDVYFRSKEELGDFLKEEMEGTWIIAHTDKALLFRYEKIEVQAIYFKYFANPQEIFDTFDFTVCMGAFDFSTEEFVLHNDFIKHNSQRILKFNQETAYPIVSALRVDKYKKKGYTISKSEFIRIMLTILKSEIKDYKTLKEQIGGMYGENYDKLIEPQEGEEFDLAVIIEKMKDLCYDDNYFKTSTHVCDIGDWDEFVNKILGVKTKCFIYNDVYYKIVSGEIKKCKDYVEDYYELVNVNEIKQFPITRFKYVRKKNEEYISYYDKSYIYKIGEYHIPKSKYSGLHAVDKSKLNSCSYSNEKDNVLLELRIDSLDDLNDISGLLSDSCEYKKVFVVREVTKEEVSSMRGKNFGEDNDNPWNF
jgi:hypothetical protein